MNNELSTANFVQDTSFELARLYEDQGHLDEALIHYARLLKLEPDNSLIQDSFDRVENAVKEGQDDAGRLRPLLTAWMDLVLIEARCEQVKSLEQCYV